MRLSGNTKRIIFGLILASSLTLPYIAFAEGRNYGFGFDPLAISIQQFQHEPTTEPTEATKKREFTSSHVGWTVVMECRSYSQDTGPSRSERQGGVDADSAQGLTALALNLHQPGASVNNEVLRQEVQS